MAGTSLNSNKPPTTETIKFLCSYGGRILPRYPDGMLRYYGGHTRVVAVNRSLSYSELMVKLGELCGKTVSLRCQLPTEDLDALVCIKSDEDLTGTQAASPPKSPSFTASYSVVRHPVAITNPCIYASPVKLPFCYNKSARKLPCHRYQNSNRFCVVSNGNHWQ
ncbi:putative PB1 domain-containing protein [Helianthus annuus]|nr:putative PB1 domain-containing protein [Helianthus annuus]